MRQALSWLTLAQDCFADPTGHLTRGLLTSVFALVVGLERIYHLDAGAGQSDAGIRALWDLVEEYQSCLDVTVRACRYPHRVAVWKALPAEQFVVYTEPGP